MSQDGGRTPEILLLGASGKVGTLLRDSWAEAVGEAARLVPVARDGRAGLRWAPGDPLDRLPQVDAVAALWGVTPGPGRDLADNTRLALLAQEIGAATGARVVLQASSGAIYRPGPDPLREEDGPDPVSAYGAAKAEMEAALTGARGPRAVCLRIGNVAGADSLFAAMAQSGTVTLDRFTDGQGPRRSYLDPADLARILAALATADTQSLPQVLNTAAPVATPMADIARAAGRAVAWREAPEGAAACVALDTERLSRHCPLDHAAASPARLARHAPALDSATEQTS